MTVRLRHMIFSAAYGLVMFFVLGSIIGSILTLARASDLVGGFGLGLSGVLAVALGHERYGRKIRPEDKSCCRNCGYDLTGNMSGRCPECGVKC